MHRSAVGIEGFTLVEMLIALSLVSVMAVIIAGALHLGARVWERSEALIETEHRSRTILERMQRQLRAANFETSESADGTRASFEGGNRSVAFLSSVALNPVNAYGWVWVRYEVDTGPDGINRLLLYEQNIALMETASGRQYQRQQNPVELASGFGALRFEYLDPAGRSAPLEWRSSWRSTNRQYLPRAVRVTYQETGAAPVRAIACITMAL